MQDKKGGVGKAPPFCLVFFRRFQEEGKAGIPRRARLLQDICCCSADRRVGANVPPFLPWREKRREQADEGIPVLPTARGAPQGRNSCRMESAVSRVQASVAEKRAASGGQPPLCLTGGDARTYGMRMRGCCFSSPSGRTMPALLVLGQGRALIPAQQKWRKMHH